MGVMLDRWAAKHQQIEDTIELLDRLEAEGAIEWDSMSTPRQKVCAFFEIDLAQLDRERRALLDEQRSLNEKES